MKTEKTDLKGLSRKDLEAFVLELGWPRYRSDQIFAWIYRRGVTDFGAMSDLAKARRQQLERSARVSSLVIGRRAVSRIDGTEKYLFRLEDGEHIESVLIKDGRRRTVCLSTQVGCALGCAYCATGELGLKRNLRAAEIVDQLIFTRRQLPSGEDVTNVVLMGMGEPLQNYREMMTACRLMNDPDGLAVGARKITISTAGVIPAMKRLAGEKLRCGLAVSLNATTDRTRSRLIPLNRKYPLQAVVAAAEDYARAIGRAVTFEYVLIDGINDTPDDARRLARIVRGIPCKINVIPYNPVPGKPFCRPSGERIEQFMKWLYPRCPTVTLRQSRGPDIQAACGQLRARADTLENH